MENIREEWTLPSSRQEYISNHPTTQISQLHSQQAMIAPTWTKISKSAWDGSATLCGGYGRRLQRSSISKDAPSYFNDPATKYHKSTPPPGRIATITRPYDKHPIESSLLLPGGASILAATRNAKQKQFDSQEFQLTRPSRRSVTRLYPHENQILLENIRTDTVRGRCDPIQWDEKDIKYSNNSNTNTYRSKIDETTRRK